GGGGAGGGGGGGGGGGRGGVGEGGGGKGGQGRGGGRGGGGGGGGRGPGGEPMTQSSPVPRFPTSLGTSDADTITLLGQDLAADLMGRVSFGELALWLVTQQR